MLGWAKSGPWFKRQCHQSHCGVGGSVSTQSAGGLSVTTLIVKLEIDAQLRLASRTRTQGGFMHRRDLIRTGILTGFALLTERAFAQSASGKIIPWSDQPPPIPPPAQNAIHNLTPWESLDRGSRLMTSSSALPITVARQSMQRRGA